MFLSDVYVIRSLVPRGKKKGDPKSSDRLFFCRRRSEVERASIELEERKLALSQAQGTLERRSVLTTREITNNSFSINGSCTGGARELTKPSPRHAEAKSEQAPEDTVRNEQHTHPELVEIWASEQNREKIRQVSLLPLPRC